MHFKPLTTYAYMQLPWRKRFFGNLRFAARQLPHTPRNWMKLLKLRRTVKVGQFCVAFDSNMEPTIWLVTRTYTYYTSMKWLGAYRLEAEGVAWPSGHIAASSAGGSLHPVDPHVAISLFAKTHHLSWQKGSDMLGEFYLTHFPKR